MGRASDWKAWDLTKVKALKGVEQLWGHTIDPAVVWVPGANGGCPHHVIYSALNPGILCFALISNETGTERNISYCDMTPEGATVEPEETSIARQRLDKQVSPTTDTQVTIEELLGTMFSFRSVQSRVQRDSDPRKTALARARSIYKRQTRPLVREGAPQEQDRNCQTVINIWSWAPDGARNQDLLTD
jgi:hypothetical protein